MAVVRPADSHPEDQKTSKKKQKQRKKQEKKHHEKETVARCERIAYQTSLPHRTCLVSCVTSRQSHASEPHDVVRRLDLRGWVCRRHAVTV